ncbi:MAG: GTP-binding protein [Halobacteriales archaeon]|nr:GTP-binding protein [Halobacteriales archaeon]
MGLVAVLKSGTFAKWLRRMFGKEHAKIGIYGPPNAGKTTLANRVVRDFAGDVMGPASPVPHETRRVRKKANVEVKANGSSLTLDVVDTPGIATKIDFHEFMEVYGMDEDEARRRAKEATEGVIEAIRWLEDVDGVILVMDANEDPFTQVNVTILGNLEARKKPVIIAANKIDMPNASPAALKNAFPQHPVVPMSALTGYNMDALYETMIKTFR